MENVGSVVVCELVVCVDGFVVAVVVSVGVGVCRVVGGVVVFGVVAVRENASRVVVAARSVLDGRVADETFEQRYPADDRGRRPRYRRRDAGQEGRYAGDDTDAEHREHRVEP